MLKEKLDRDSARVYLQLEKPEETEDEIDLVNVASAMGRKKMLYFHVLMLAVCAGICLGLMITGIQYITGNKSCASAVIRFQYSGIDKGLDPKGDAFDINKLKSPAVIETALEMLGITDISIEDVRQNMVIEGVVPEDALHQIMVLQEIAADDVSYYEKVLDVTYFPSQYVVHLYKGGVMTSSEATEILNAVLSSYRDYFMDLYADREVLTVTSKLIDYAEYDYMEAVEMLETQLDIMQSYVARRRAQASALDFRSSRTGLSFSDIEMSLRTIEDIELSKIASYIENAALTKDKEKFEELYNYKIRKYNMNLSEFQVQLTTVENTLNAYVKDPAIIVSSQDSAREITQKNAYYDSLVERKLALNRQIISVNTDLKEAYELLDRISVIDTDTLNTQEQYDYADVQLQKVSAAIAEWVTLTEETTEEYYSTALFSNAYEIAVPAKYYAEESIAQLAKSCALCAAVMVFAVIVIWCADGFRTELVSMRKKRKRG